MADAELVSRSPRRGGGATRSQPSLLDLPDALFARILALLSQQDRFQNVALVSHRLRGVCLAPELLRSMAISSSSPTPYLPDPPDPVPRLHALLGLLAGHGSHVRSLDICIIKLPEDDQSPEVASLVAQCLEACCAAGGSLQQLRVSRWTPLTEAGCMHAARLTRLTALTLGCYAQPVQLPAALSQLTGLQVAELVGSPLTLEGPCLPTSLTSLSIYDRIGTAMPSQLSLLQRLVQLDVAGLLYQPACMWPLPLLHSLRRLKLFSGCVAPAEANGPWDEEAMVELDSVLAQLRGLTCLSLLGVPYVPPGIADMSRLECLHVRNDYHPDLVANALPRGPWLRSIRWLGLPWECLADPGNMGALRSAAQLEFLCALGLPSASDHEEGWNEWEAFCEWLAGHPPLRCFGFAPGDVWEVTADLLNAVLNLKHRRPPQLMLRHIDYDSPGFEKEMLGCEDIPSEPTPFGGW